MRMQLYGCDENAVHNMQHGHADKAVVDHHRTVYSAYAAGLAVTALDRLLPEVIFITQPHSLKSSILSPFVALGRLSTYGSWNVKESTVRDSAYFLYRQARVVMVRGMGNGIIMGGLALSLRDTGSRDEDAVCVQRAAAAGFIGDAVGVVIRTKQMKAAVSLTAGLQSAVCMGATTWLIRRMAAANSNHSTSITKQQVVIAYPLACLGWCAAYPFTVLADQARIRACTDVDTFTIRHAALPEIPMTLQNVMRGFMFGLRVTCGLAVFGYVADHL